MPSGPLPDHSYSHPDFFHQVVSEKRKRQQEIKEQNRNLKTLRSSSSQLNSRVKPISQDIEKTISCFDKWCQQIKNLGNNPLSEVTLEDVKRVFLQFRNILESGFFLKLFIPDTQEKIDQVQQIVLPYTGFSNLQDYRKVDKQVSFF